MLQAHNKYGIEYSLASASDVKSDILHRTQRDEQTKIPQSQAIGIKFPQENTVILKMRMQSVQNVQEFQLKFS